MYFSFQHLSSSYMPNAFVYYLKHDQADVDMDFFSVFLLLCISDDILYPQFRKADERPTLEVDEMLNHFFFFFLLSLFRFENE